jgi:hypothetical protein
MTMPHGTLADRAAYRRACHAAAQRGGLWLSRFVLSQNVDMFADQEVARVRRYARVYGWDNLANFVNQRFKQMRGQAHDPRMDKGNFPTVIETIITPHALIKHNL